MTNICRLLQACAVLSAVAVPLVAGTFSYTGAFTEDDNFAAFSFTVPVQEIVTMRTWSYAGGTNAANALIASGGFDPELTLFDALGNWQGANDDGGGVVVSDSATGNAFDSFLSVNLAPGAYNLYLTEADNSAVDALLSDGFTWTGQGNFSCPEFIGQPGPFCDATPAFRNGNYAVDISFADAPASTPEPATGATFILLAAASALSRFKREWLRP